MYDSLLAHYVLIKITVMYSETKLNLKIMKRPTLYILSYVCVHVHINILA